MKITKATDKQALLTHFQKDPVLFAYHIGDLDPFFFEICWWPVLLNDNGHIEEAVLVYNNPDFPTIMLFGVTDRFQGFLEQVIPDLPRNCFVHFQHDSHRVLASQYAIKPLGTHFKMRLVDFKPGHKEKDADRIIRLDASHAEMMVEFYHRSYPDVYFDKRILETKKVYGYFDGDNLASVASLHVYSNEYDIAVLGSIATHPAFRGRNLATRTTSYLVDELVREGKMICLNVKFDNDPAIRVYKRLGFEIVHQYEEALIERAVSV